MRKLHHHIGEVFEAPLFFEPLVFLVQVLELIEGYRKVGLVVCVLGA